MKNFDPLKEIQKLKKDKERPWKYHLIFVDNFLKTKQKLKSINRK